MTESSTVEFKREYVEDIKKTVIAFANCQGGELYIGIEDDGSVCGVKDADDCQLRAVNAIRDAVRPDVSMFTFVEVCNAEGVNTVKITVQQGTARPYYLSGKGIRPEGVYVRRGASTVSASEAEILKMIRETAGDDYETARSLNQQLTFNYTEKYFVENGISFGDEQKRTLGIILQDGTFSDLGLLLSDQCVHTIRFAVFEGANKTVFKDRKEFGGSLLKQSEEVYDHISLFNHLHSHFEGLQRVDICDYPVEAVREALLNSIVHRDYSFSSSTLISVFDDRIEFVTVGGLIKGITKSDIMLGISVLRNRRLAEVFYRLHLIEAYGTGMPKIQESYSESKVKPKIEISDNAFKITLPNVNYKPQTEKKNTSVGAPKNIPEKALSKREKQILSYLKEHSAAARHDIQKLVKCSQTTTLSTLGKMADKGLIQKRGEGKQTVYVLKE